LAFEPIIKRLAKLEARQPEKGDPGKDGKDGKDAAPISLADVARDLLAAPELMDFVDKFIADRIKANPPRDGKDGKDGNNGDKGDPGKDGKSITLEDVLPVLKTMQAEWALDFERRAQAVFQKAIDAIPKPVDGKDGRDGVDGLGWDDLSVEFDGKRVIAVKMTRGDIEKVAGDIKMPVVLDAGFWKEGSYEMGDGVTFGGSYWIAQKDTISKPEVGNPDWRLAVKKGRDGKRD
jgi:integrin beta 3